MADKRVSDLPSATELGDNDLLVVEQAGEAKALPGAKIKSPPTDEQVAAAVEAYLVKNPPQAVSSQALALVRQLLGKAVYTEDVTADLAALDALLGGGELPDEWSVIAELTEADLVVGHGWSVSYPYYEVRSTRTSGTGLNLNVPITAGTYRFEFAAAADVQMSAVVYNQDAKAAMQIDGDWSRDDMIQTGWAASGVELVVPETINGTAPAGLILTFRLADESDVYQGMIHGITVARYIASDEPDEPVVPPEEPETDSGLELIAMYTLPEDVTSVTIDKDDNGQPYELDFAVLNVDVVGSSQNTGQGDMQIRINGNSEYPTVVPGRTTGTASSHKYIGAKIICGDYVHLYAEQYVSAITAGMDTAHNSLSSLVLEGITDARAYLGAGTKIALYGHRKDG